MRRKTHLEQLERLTEAGPSEALSQGRMELRFFDASSGLSEDTLTDRREAAANAAAQRARARQEH